jgi:tripartite-type tricarboxylate transporter receptor subunit TctC
MAASRALLKAGMVKALGVASDSRRSGYADIPTFKEQGVRVQSVAYWESLVVPKDTPNDRIKVLEDAIAKTIKDPQITKKLEEADIELEFRGSHDTIQFRKAQDDFLRVHTEALGLRIGK